MSQKELNSKLLEAAEKGDTDRMWELVEQGADINTRDRWGRTALMRSAYKGHLTLELLEAFIRNGTDINAIDNHGYTALMELAFWGCLTPELLNVFTAHGANLNISDDTGSTALLLSEEGGYLTLELARAFAEQFIRLGTPLKKIYKQTYDSNQSAMVLITVLLDRFETEPNLVVNFIKKSIGKKMEYWVKNDVEGANILVSRLVPYMEKQAGKVGGMGIEFF